jgi:hypothetical protein
MLQHQHEVRGDKMGENRRNRKRMNSVLRVVSISRAIT